jgi:two-component system, NtrC family, response regulator HydG
MQQEDLNMQQEDLSNTPNGNHQPLKKSLREIAVKAEYDVISKVLAEVNNNKTKAAFVLNINRKTLYNKLKGFKENGITDEN